LAILAVQFPKPGMTTDIVIGCRLENVGLKCDNAVANVKNCHCSSSGAVTKADSAAELAPVWEWCIATLAFEQRQQTQF